MNMKTHTLRTHPNPSIKLRASLLHLQETLTAAGSGVPARPPRADLNEQRALQLIARMQAEYKKIAPFLDLHDIPNPDARTVHVRQREWAGAQV
jgi:hypothetical protein